MKKISDWKQSTIGQLSKLATGTTPPSKNTDYFGGNVRWFTPQDVVDQLYLASSSRTLTQKAVREKKARIFEKGTILLTAIGNIGRVGILESDSSANQQITGISVTTKEIDKEYLFYWLLGHRTDILARASQATLPIINQAKIKEIPVSYPLFDEQRRIVARIKECMERNDEIERLQGEQSREEAHILRAARRELFGRPITIPEGWQEQRLDSLADVIYGISEAISGNKDPKIGPPIVRMANISLDGHLDLSDLRYCPIPRGKEEHFALKPGDLLLNWRSGSAQHVGKTAIFEEEGLYTCASFILRIRSIAGASNNRYLRHVLNYMRAENIFLGESRMQVNHKLNAKEFSAFMIRIPPKFEDQEAIADQLDSTETYTNQVRELFQQKKTELNELRASILRKAFSGEL